MMRAAYPFLVLCVLGLAHVHLQFARIDMLMQQSQLQVKHRQLLREENSLKARLATMGNLEDLKVVARRHLNMQEVENPTKELLVEIPATLQAKYSAPIEPEQTDVLVAQMKSERQQGLRAALMSLIDGGRAVASVSVQRP